MKRQIFKVIGWLIEECAVLAYGKDALLGFYIARMTALGLRHGVNRGQLHKAIDRCCVLLWEDR